MTTLKIVLETLPDKGLISSIEKERGKGRDDFPARAMWNLVVAGVVFGHATMASLLRELRRNIQLAHVCGFGFSKLPSDWNMSRFIAILLKHEDEIRDIFEGLCQELYLLLSSFGQELAIDSKWIESAANKASKKRNPDGRSETDARKGIKRYSGIREDGTAWEKTMSCFGFKVHLLADANYELPIAYEVTDAATSDIAQSKKMIKKLGRERSEVLEACHSLMADRGYDSTELITMLKGKDIKAVIDKRAMWKGQTEKQVPGYEDAYYDEAGNVYCYTSRSERKMMVPNGYEQKRGATRFKCPASAYGIGCPDIAACKCKNIRIPLSTDPRIFTQVQRGTCKWKRLYKKRTAVERINSRLDGAYKFEEKRMRGLGRAKLHIGLALLTMLVIAVWKARDSQMEYLRSLVKIA